MLIHQSENSSGDDFYKVTHYVNKGWNYHFHVNPELIYVYEGGLDIHNSYGQDMVGVGEFCLFLSGEPHAMYPKDNARFCICIFSESYVREFVNKISGKMATKAVFKCSEEKEAFIKSILFKDDKPDELEIRSMLYAACGEYMMHSSLMDIQYDKIEADIKMLKYISDNFHREISLKKMSDELGYEYHYLSRKFNKRFNMSFKNYLNQYRFRKARQMLYSDKISMTEIAHQSGFQSVRNFNNVFKSITGMGPREYMKKEQRNIDFKIYE